MTTVVIYHNSMLLPKTPFSTSNHFGISLTSSSIRAMEVDAKGQVVRSADRFFNSPVISSSGIKTAPLLEALKAVIAEGGFQGHYAAVCLSEKFAYSRSYVLPKLQKTEIAEAIYWQLEKIFPFNRDEIYYDWKLISQDDTKSVALVTVIPSSLLDELKSVLISAGISPISFEPSASALSRLIPPEQSSQLILLELDNLSASSSLVLDQVSVLTTTATLQSDLSGDQVLNRLQQSINDIKSYLSRNKITTTSLHIVLTGEKASPQVASILQQALNIPTSVLNIPQVDPSHHLVYVTASQQILPPESSKSINLLPQALQKYYASFSHYELSRHVLIYCLALVLTALFISGIGFGSTILAKSSHQSRLQTIAATTPTVGSGQFNIAVLNQTAQRIIRLFPRKTSPEQFLVLLYNSIPDGITLQQVRYDAGTKSFEIIGIATSRTTLLHFRDQISETGVFQNPSIPLSSLEANENIEFTLKFNLNPNPQI